MFSTARRERASTVSCKSAPDERAHPGRADQIPAKVIVSTHKII